MLDKEADYYYSDCCDAKIYEPYRGFGRCSDCGEMSEAIPDYELYDPEDDFDGQPDWEQEWEDFGERYN